MVGRGRGIREMCWRLADLVSFGAVCRPDPGGAVVVALRGRPGMQREVFFLLGTKLEFACAKN